MFVTLSPPLENWTKRTSLKHKHTESYQQTFDIKMTKSNISTEYIFNSTYVTPKGEMVYKHGKCKTWQVQKYGNNEEI